MTQNKHVLVLFGPTASGKSKLAMSVANKCNAVIVNCDSKQLYKEIPIITAQPTLEDMQKVEHEMYGIISVAEHCSVARWIDMVKPIIKKIWSEGKVPLLVGGTGLYIKHLINGMPQIPDISDDIRMQVRENINNKGSKYIHAQLDNEMQEKLQPADSQRVARAYEVLIQTGKSLYYWQNMPAVPVLENALFSQFFLSPQREEVYKNCNMRFNTMINTGVIEEIKNLYDMQLSESLPSMKAHGVPEIAAYIRGDLNLDEAIIKAQRNTRRYIKRQFTWFRSQMPEANIIEGDEKVEKILSIIKQVQNQL